MTASASAAPRSLAAPSFALVLGALVALTAIRLIGLRYSAVDLFFDEAQYWAWSRELAFGYFSKPPLLAWIIATADKVCGSGEACVRAASPVFYLGTTLLVYALARELHDRQTAAWSALALMLATGLSFSSRIISTDVPLLLFWTAGLLAYVKLLCAPDWRWAVVLGVSLGLGTLAKYAMVYFLLGAALAALLDRDAQTLWLRGQTWAALAIAALIVAPNVYWNVANDFITFRHTGDNITGDGLRLRPLDAVAFVAAQFAVVGPLVFGAFLVILFRLRSQPIGRSDRLMLAFAIPPLALVTALAFFRYANANWAAPALLSMTILVVAWWVRHALSHWLWGTLAIGATLQVVLLVGDVAAYRITVPALRDKADLYQRTLGWRALGQEAAQLARKAGARSVATEGRSEVAALIYYLRDEPLKALAWPGRRTPQHQFDLTRALDDSAAEPVLFVSGCPAAGRLRKIYREVTPVGSFEVSTGPSSARRYHAFKLASRQHPVEPLGPCV